MTTHMKRTEHIRVRLVPADFGHAIEVTLSTKERRALEKAAGRLGAGTRLSTFIRTLGAYGAAQMKAKGEPEVRLASQIEAAADACNMSVGEWLRVIALTAVGATPLIEHLDAASHAVEDAIAKGEWYE